MSSPAKPTTESVDDNAAVARGTVYGTLAKLYQEPTEDLFEALADGSLFEELERLVERTELDVEVPSVQTTDDYELLCARFNDLFVVGYPDPVIPRHESEHVETPWNEVNLDLTRVYDYFDVEIDQSEREHHDFLVIELEFAGYLSRLASTGQADARRARADFLDRHLKPFVDGLEAGIEDEVETGIYDDVVAFTADFVRADYQNLTETLEAEP
ncbi:molecular chaperone TorD family protein [Halodesulfurarchaeum sp.]|uniref:molecular chaperone TorD family protein n=1 Tax=Halodesulfurarchaeum sp. TaxID=1980530 RepID=UPI002FC359A1